MRVCLFDWLVGLALVFLEGGGVYYIVCFFVSFFLLCLFGVGFCVLVKTNILLSI